LPFIEQNTLFQSGLTFNPQATWSAPIPPSSNTTLSANNLPLQSQPVKVYVCPADATVLNGLCSLQTQTAPASGIYPWAAASYAANNLLFGTVTNADPNAVTTAPGINNSFGPTFNIGNIPDGSTNTVFFGEQFSACGTTTGSLWAYPGIGNYSGSQYANGAANGNLPPTGSQAAPIVNVPGSSTGALWTPVFANNHPFSHHGTAPVPATPGPGSINTGSIYLYNNQYGNPPQGAPPGYQQITATTGGGSINTNTPGWDVPGVFFPTGGGVLAYWDTPPQSGATQATCDKSRLQSFHAANVMVCMGDGSVRPVSTGVTQPTWYAAINPADGVPFGPDW
jgi:hypothetical protein